MAREERNIIGFTVALVSEFALRFGIRPRQAYAYLKRYKGMEHLREHYAVPKQGRTVAMINVYHESNQKIEVPDRQHSKPFKDFGRGFYLSPDKQQA